MHHPTKQGYLLPLLLLALFLLCGCARGPAVSPEAPVPGVLRLHVIANSDSPEDQAVKLRVRDALLSLMEGKQTLQEAKRFLLENRSLLQQAAERTLEENGFPYGASFHLGVYPFPDRDYGDVTYPAGNYEALRVVLGEGQGQNWWCVLFPPLCILSQDAEPLEEGILEFHSSILSWWRNRT